MTATPQATQLTLEYFQDQSEKIAFLETALNEAIGCGNFRIYGDKIATCNGIIVDDKETRPNFYKYLKTKFSQR
jgi:hypothetical protein